MDYECTPSDTNEHVDDDYYAGFYEVQKSTQTKNMQDKAVINHYLSKRIKWKPEKNGAVIPVKEIASIFDNNM